MHQYAAELLAYAFCELFPEAQLVEGRATRRGFFYEFIVSQPVDASFIPMLEEKMRSKPQIQLLEMMRENAAELLRHHNQEIRASFVGMAPQNIVTIAKIGSFHDWSAYPIENQDFGAVKILKLERSKRYVSENEQVEVVRVEGAVFDDKKAMKAFLKQKEGAEERHHIKIGQEQAFFTEMEGDGWLWLPRGAQAREALIDFWREENRTRGFLPIVSPGLESAHVEAFASQLRSYRELPLRYAEMMENCEIGENRDWHGLLRSGNVTLDVGHSFCLSEQLYQELSSSLQFIDKTVKILAFDCRCVLSKRSKRFAGTASEWDAATHNLEKALTDNGLQWETTEDPDVHDGPRVDVYLIDALGREWPGPYVQVDFSLAERHTLRYRGADDAVHTPLVVKRSLFGPLEHFIAIVVEHTAGVLPLWLAPEQLRVLPVREENNDEALALSLKLQAAGFRTGVDLRDETLGAKIHSAQHEKVPYAIVAGNKEKRTGTLTVRPYGDREAYQVEFDTFVEQVKEKERKKVVES